MKTSLVAEEEEHIWKRVLMVAGRQLRKASVNLIKTMQPVEFQGFGNLSEPPSVFSGKSDCNVSPDERHYKGVVKQQKPTKLSLFINRRALSSEPHPSANVFSPTIDAPPPPSLLLPSPHHVPQQRPEESKLDKQALLLSDGPAGTSSPAAK